MTDEKYCPLRETQRGEGYNIKCINCDRKDFNECGVYHLVNISSKQTDKTSKLERIGKNE